MFCFNYKKHSSRGLDTHNIPPNLDEKMALQGALTHIITSLRDESENTANTANNKIQTDLLNSLLQPNFTTIVKMYDEITTSDSPEESMRCIEQTVHNVNQEFSKSNNEESVVELLSILNQPHMKGLLQASHDIANRRFEPEPFQDRNSRCIEDDMSELRTIEVEFEKPQTKLGFTLIMEDGQVKVARIIQHGYIATQGLLSEGDVIIAVNNETINGHHLVEDVQRLLRHAVGVIKLRIIPSNRPNRLPLEDYFVQANFNYQADSDKSLPAQSVGLSFKKGSILQILSQEDQYWWQAKLVSASRPSDFCGLIPSLVFEERRRAKTYKKRHKSSEDVSTCKCYPSKMKSLKHSYSSVFTDISNTLDQYEMHLYEEVAQVPSFERKSIVIIATHYSLRKYIVNKLEERDPTCFAKPVEYTNDVRAQSQENARLSYLPMDQLLAEVQNKNFLTVTKCDNVYSCVKEDSIKEIIENGRVCVMEVEVQDLKLVKRVIFAPLIVLIRTQHIPILQECNRAITPKQKMQSLQMHIKESDHIMSQYGHMVDVAVDITPSKMVETILDAKKTFSEGPQWVPASWVY